MNPFDIAVSEMSFAVLQILMADSVNRFGWSSVVGAERLYVLYEARGKAIVFGGQPSRNSFSFTESVQTIGQARASGQIVNFSSESPLLPGKSLNLAESHGCLSQR